MYMRPFNLTGQPALSLCNGFDDTGLPLSLQIVGREFTTPPTPNAHSAPVPALALSAPARAPNAP